MYSLECPETLVSNLNPGIWFKIRRDDSYFDKSKSLYLLAKCGVQKNVTGRDFCIAHAHKDNTYMLGVSRFACCTIKMRTQK